MVTLTIATVLLSLAGPDFREAIARARLSGSANEVLAAMQLARSEAVRQNQRVVMCRSEDGSTCSSLDAAWPGWILFEDKDGDGTRDSDEPVIKSGTIDAPTQVVPSPALAALAQRLTFRGDGRARAADGRSLLNATLAVCVAGSRPIENVRDVSIASGARTAVTRRGAAGACGTPAD